MLVTMKQRYTACTTCTCTLYSLHLDNLQLLPSGVVHEPSLDYSAVYQDQSYLHEYNVQYKYTCIVYSVMICKVHIPCITSLTSTCPLDLYTIRMTGSESGFTASTLVAILLPNDSFTISSNLRQRENENMITVVHV